MNRPISPHPAPRRRSSASSDPEPTTPIGTIGSAPGLLAEARVDADATARAAGIDPSRFADPASLIRFSEMSRYLGECIRATRDDRFALRMGLSEGPGALNAIGYLAQHSPDVRSSLVTLKTYVHHFAGAISVRRQRGLAIYEYNFLHPHIESAGLITEAAMGLSLAVLQKLCGPAWSAIEVRLARPLPLNPQAWRRCVHAPIVFGSTQNRIVFSAKWLDQPVESADRALHRILHDHVAGLDATRTTSLPVQVRAVIRAALLAGYATPRHVADRLALGTRTLARRLAQNGTSFEVLLDDTRHEIACQLLGNSSASITKIADLLGYAHSSAFTRAFRRWADTSPREWRHRSRATADTF